MGCFFPKKCKKVWKSQSRVFNNVASIYARFIGTKEITYLRKEFSTSKGLVWYTNMAAISLFLNNNIAAETSCENTPMDLINLVKISSDFVIEPVPDQIQQHPDLQQF